MFGEEKPSHDGFGRPEAVAPAIVPEVKLQLVLDVNCVALEQLSLAGAPPPFVAKDADTFVLLVIVRLQLPAPPHAPPHVLKVEPAAGVAVSDTPVPDGRVALHVPLAVPALMVQLIPLPVTVPWPLPPPDTISVTFDVEVWVTQIWKFASTPLGSAEP